MIDHLRAHASHFVSAIFLCLLISGCDDGPTKPKPSDDYLVYFADLAGPNRIYAFHPASQRFDSAYVPWDHRVGITVSADGSLLYLTGRSEVTVITADSFSLVTTLPYVPEAPVAVSPDGEMVAVCGDDLHILRTSDYSVVYSDTTFVGTGCFSSDSKAFYCPGWTEELGNHVYRLDLSDSAFSVSRRVFPEGLIVYVIPTIDETKWLLYLRLPPLWTYAFEVYDAEADSIVFTDVLVPGAGDLALSPDGRYAFYSSPGRTSTDPPPEPSFWMFDIEQNATVREIRDTIAFEDSTWYAPPSRLVVTPDSRYVAIIGGQMALGAFYLYEIETDSLVYSGREHAFEHIYSWTVTAQLSL